MKTNRIWIILGISAFSIVLGFLIGSSNSPVIGAALSSLFGVIIALLSLIETDNDKRFKLNYDRLNFTGKILFIFSALLFVGVISGDNYRNDNISLLKEKQAFPWGNNPPESTFEALDWIVASQKLKQIGYTKEQINSLYKIREKEILKFKNDTLNDDVESEDDVYGFDEKTESGYDKSSPFNAVISSSTIEAAKVTRGPASIE
jgi:hypothetical protein